MVKLEVGMRLRLKKPHPCGSEVWEILRTGVDVRLRCCGCGRIILLPREKVLRLLRAVESPGHTP
ncbi:protein of unknown function DUF951 [Ammonifex degensii KC4]|uniref:DUF951 domain-containing protein n=1 Tax=Ammonifex degensii (strain DSM 10501 / KC4) TaxID=429009 RepID=C9RAH0_AMMDK|nr:DUF951 domain-containing protein [Ammonifex degensii]ACX53216.1 protein of unknown function DUF951 [Ammonifex degensii KC4]